MTNSEVFGKPEVMSPAGYWPQLEAAVAAGADAVYFGLTHFSARAKVGFGLTELPGVLRQLHQHGVKGYVTFNTLAFDHELPAAARALAAIAEAGADALIVQDLGLARLAQEVAPGIEIHGSTQMSITSAEGVALAQRYGVQRVVLARELSLDDVRAIRAQTDCALELFVHGALCVSYSGQCFSSEAWGGRSANRGQCAQACRLPYDLLVDGQQQPLGAARYLLSPGDLYALHQLPEIIRLGISALKIEGRYKDASYVALTTRAYRQALDDAWAGLPLSLSRADELQLEQTYSRGLGPFFISGTNHQAVVNGRAPRHRGLLVGRVARLTADGVLVLPNPDSAAAPLKPGDGLVFDAADWRSPELPEEGGRVYEARPQPDGRVELRFANAALDRARIRPGDLLWRSHDPEVERAARRISTAKSALRRQALNLHVRAHENEPLLITWVVAAQPALTVTVASDAPLARAEQHALSVETLHAQLGRLGGTPYELAEIALDTTGQPFVPSSMLNQLRRQAVEQLTTLQAQPQARPPTHDPQLALAALLAQPDQVQAQSAERLNAERRTIVQRDAVQQLPQLHVLVRSAEQLEAALALRPASITLDYLDLYGLRPAVERVQQQGIEARVASPRILKPSEQRVVRFLLKLGCPILLRSGGLLEALQAGEHPQLIGDFSLNAANSISAQSLLNLGLQRITPTHDLNAAQIADLARSLGPERLEVVVYQHLPVFHTEHCVFCRFLSTGTSYRDCGHPCERHQVALRDSAGRAHPLMADVGCRNTVFGAEAQEASRHLDDLRAAGLRHLRLEFVHERGDELRAVVEAFQAALQGTITAAELGRCLRQITPGGTTEGSLFVPDSYLAVPLLQ